MTLASSFFNVEH